MAVNYLDYLRSMRQDSAPEAMIPRYLVSGIDGHVRQVVGEQIVRSCRDRDLTLFFVDSTKDQVGFGPDFFGYRTAELLQGELALCSELLEVHSIQGISLLRSVLAALGFDSKRSMQVVSYLSFVREVERRLGNTEPLSARQLEEYGSCALVERKLREVARAGGLSEDNLEYLLTRYSEVSAAAADFECILVLLYPFLGSVRPAGDLLVHVPIGSFAADPPMQNLICLLLKTYLDKHADRSAVLILDDGKGDRLWLNTFLPNLPAGLDLHMITDDAFSLSDSIRNTLINACSVRVYTRHADMDSCKKIEAQCGEIEVQKRGSAVSVDQHIRANSPLDLLLGTNRTETSYRNAPTREAWFQKEFINKMPKACGIIDCGGTRTLMPF